MHHECVEPKAFLLEKKETRKQKFFSGVTLTNIFILNQVFFNQ